MKAKKTLVFTNYDPSSMEEAVRSDQQGGVWVSKKSAVFEVKALIKGLLTIADDGDSLRVTVELEDLADDS